MVVRNTDIGTRARHKLSERRSRGRALTNSFPRRLLGNTVLQRRCMHIPYKPLVVSCLLGMLSISIMGCGGSTASNTSQGPGAPSITWSIPPPIQYGAALSSVQLDASANVPGTFTYAPAAGTVLPAGSQKLTATFTPSDTNTYSTATSSVQLTVTQANPVITWAPLSAIQQGSS